MVDKEFARRAALITGGSRGIGRAVAVKLARGGADVAINYLSRDEDALAAKALVEREGVRCILVKGNVADPDDVEAMVRTTRDALGPIGLLVTSAGISMIENHAEISYESWKKTIAINLDGTFLPILAVKDEMMANQYGRIVCLSSVAALRPRPLQIHYSASKAGVIALVRSCGEAFAPHVRVNCVAPGLIDTEMAAVVSPAAAEAIVAATPLRRMGTPEEVANVVYFLLSDQSSYMTGQTVAACGGRVTLP